MTSKPSTPARPRKGSAPRSKTAPSTPRLSEYARKFVFPAGIERTVWPRVEAKGLELGLGFDWWQAQAGTVILGYGKDGKYVATVGGVGMSIPRQVGKTYFVLALIVILCILFPGTQVVWTAHHLRTSTKTFTTLRGIARRKKVAPHIKSIRAANGEQEVEFANGSKIMFGARAQGFGRGFDEIDIEVFDEAQILDTKALEDMVAATNQARHEHGALLLYMGTPPRPTDPSEAFMERRSEAWAGEAEDAIWLEISAEPGSDPNDRTQWPRMNPSYPSRTPLESLMRLRKNLKDDDSWNREGRGIWDEELGDHVVPLGAWATGLKPGSRIELEPFFALDVSPSRAHASIAVAGQVAGGWHVELTSRHGIYDSRHGLDWVERRLREIRESFPNMRIAIAANSAAASLIPSLEASGFKVDSVSEISAACGFFYDRVVSGELVHLGQKPLDDALTGAIRRDVGDNSFVWWRRKSSGDITPLYAATLALWQAEQSRTDQLAAVLNVW